MGQGARLPRPRVTSTVWEAPDASAYVSVTLSPGAFERTAATSASAPSIARSSTLVTTTPLGQTSSRGRTVSDHLGDRRPVRAGIVCELHA